MNKIVAALALAALAGCATNPATLTPSHFASTALVQNDGLDVVATVSTSPGYKDRILGRVFEDNFVRAFVDHASGDTRYQLYQVIWYGEHEAGGWQFYHTANYEAPGGPVSVPVSVLDRSVDCEHYERGCSYDEHVAFDIPSALFQDLASRAESEPGGVWRFKFISQSGVEHIDQIQYAELAGLLERIRTGI